MNPETNRFERLRPDTDQNEDPGVSENESLAGLRRLVQQQHSSLVRPNGEPVPRHWTQFRLGELVEIKNYRFRVAYIGETTILFEPFAPVIIGDPNGVTPDDLRDESAHLRATQDKVWGAADEALVAEYEAQNRYRELRDALLSAFSALDKLLEDKPLWAAKICGSTTLGNVRAEIWEVLHGRQ